MQFSEIPIIFCDIDQLKRRFDMIYGYIFNLFVCVGYKKVYVNVFNIFMHKGSTSAKNALMILTKNGARNNVMPLIYNIQHVYETF